jgi:hypothetical protein
MAYVKLHRVAMTISMVIRMVRAKKVNTVCLLAQLI